MTKMRMMESRVCRVVILGGGPWVAYTACTDVGGNRMMSGMRRVSAALAGMLTAKTFEMGDLEAVDALAGSKFEGHLKGLWEKSEGALARSIKYAEEGGYLPTLADTADLWAAYWGRCEICDKHESEGALHADHDHKTGKFRGWLCSTCNSYIVSFLENPERNRSFYVTQSYPEPAYWSEILGKGRVFQASVRYLQRHS